MTQNYSKTAYNISEINKISKYDILLFNKIYLNILKYLDKSKYILEFGCGELKWFQYLYIKGFRKFIFIEIDTSFYNAQKKFIKKYYKDVEIIHINDNIININNYKNINNISLFCSFQVIEHIKYSDLTNLFKSMNKNLADYFLLETINAQNIIQGNFAIYHDSTHINSFTPRSLKMLLSEINSFNFIKTIGVPYPGILNVLSLIRLGLDLKSITILIYNSIYGIQYNLSKLISRFFISRYVSKEDNIYDSGFAIFFKK